MIVRLWHGRTARNRANEYAVFLKEQAIPDLRDAEGNLEVDILRRDEADVSHFMVITRWDSEAAVRAYVGGNDARKAKYYPEDRGFLLELEPEVQQYELAAKAP